MMKLAIAVIAAALLAGCSTVAPPPREGARPVAVTPFSAGRPGGALPGHWEPWILARFKRPTHYELVRDAGATVVHARAEASASGLSHPLDDLDAREYRDLRWRWRVDELLRTQDNTRRATEDASVRLVIRFGGDMAKLDFAERTFAAQVKAMTGQDLPYATLMYIWGRRAEVDRVIVNRHTERIRMIVAETGPAHLGTWRDFRRDLYEDFKRAFEEEPGPITGIGIMTDTDNTGETAHAWYGDISLTKRAAP